MTPVGGVSVPNLAVLGSGDQQSVNKAIEDALKDISAKLQGVQSFTVDALTAMVAALGEHTPPELTDTLLALTDAGLARVPVSDLQGAHGGMVTAPSGYWLRFGTTVCATPVPVAVGDNQLYLAPFVTARDCTLTKLQVEVASITGTATIRLGVYDTAANGLPHTLLGETSNLTTGTTRVGTVTIPLAAGATYWGAVLCDVGTTLELYAIPADAALPWGGIGGSGGASVPPMSHLYRTVSSGWTALPNPVGTVSPSSTDMPVLEAEVG